MLETIREFAAERLQSSGEAEGLQRRHAEHFLALAEEAEPNLRWSGSPAAWLERLEREHDNLRASLDWLQAAGESQLNLAAGRSGLAVLDHERALRGGAAASRKRARR